MRHWYKSTVRNWEKSRRVLGELAASQYAANWNLPPRSNIASRRVATAIISISMYGTSDRSGRNTRGEATRRTRNARRNNICMRVCVIVRHMSPSVDLNFKLTLKSDLRASTLIDTHRSVIESWGEPAGCRYREQNVQSCAPQNWAFSASYSIIRFFVQYIFRRGIYICFDETNEINNHLLFLAMAF